MTTTFKAGDVVTLHHGGSGYGLAVVKHLFTQGYSHNSSKSWVVKPLVSVFKELDSETLVWHELDMLKVELTEIQKALYL